MNNPKQTEEVDVSEELGYHPAKISDQIAGKWFPDTKVKEESRWAYMLLSWIVLLGVLFEAVAAIMVLFSR